MNIDGLEKYMIDDEEIIKKYGSKDYAEMFDIIHSHNNAIAQFSTGLSIHTVMMILIKKGIITEQEMLSELNESITTFKPQFDAVENNYNKIMEMFNQLDEIAEGYGTLRSKLDERFPDTSTESNSN